MLSSLRLNFDQLGHIKKNREDVPNYNGPHTALGKPKYSLALWNYSFELPLRCATTSCLAASSSDYTSAWHYFTCKRNMDRFTTLHRLCSLQTKLPELISCLRRNSFDVPDRRGQNFFSRIKDDILRRYSPGSNICYMWCWAIWSVVLEYFTIW